MVVTGSPALWWGCDAESHWEVAADALPMLGSAIQALPATQERRQGGRPQVPAPPGSAATPVQLLAAAACALLRSGMGQSSPEILCESLGAPEIRHGPIRASRPS